MTEAFNTTSSMGRLTLNVLLSFAQFEREVTGERIRDKIAASKRKGIWMGGVVPLGYRVETRALHVVEEHARLIREIYARYLELGSVSAVKAALDTARIAAPVRTNGAGRVTGGRSFSRGHLTAILGNPVYAGRLAHKGDVHEGQHPAIVDLATWEAVQAKRAANHRGHTARRLASMHLLIGRIRDQHGTTMSPTHAQKGSRRYRYYASRLPRDAGRDPPAAARVPAPEIETQVVQALRAAIPAGRQPESDTELIAACLTRVTVHPDRLELTLAGDEDAIHVPWSPAPNRRRREIVAPAHRAGERLRPMKVEDRARILRAIATGRAWMRELAAGSIDSPLAIASREDASERSVRMTLSLAHLSPAIVGAIMDGRLPRGIGIRHLADLPPAWSDQHATLGL